jgi:hypothetical protein
MTLVVMLIHLKRVAKKWMFIFSQRERLNLKALRQRLSIILQFALLFMFLMYAQAAPTIYVGAVEGTDALVAVVIEDGQILAYSCGGNRTWESHSSWFPINEQSVLGDGSFTLTGQRGHILQGFYSAEAAEGRLTLPDGTEAAWSADIISQGTAAGLYRLSETSEEAEDLLGFIVSNDLRTVGNIRHILPRRNTVSFAPVGLAQALPAETPESLMVCFTLEDDPTCKQLARVTTIK